MALILGIQSWSHQRSNRWRGSGGGARQCLTHHPAVDAQLARDPL